MRSIHDVLVVNMTSGPSLILHRGQWPVVARASDDSWIGGDDWARYSQARGRGELDEYRLIVRRREDGAVVVYGTLIAGNGRSDAYAGEQLKAPVGNVELIGALSRVARDAGLPSRMVKACIKALPAGEVRS